MSNIRVVPNVGGFSSPPGYGTSIVGASTEHQAADMLKASSQDTAAGYRAGSGRSEKQAEQPAPSRAGLRVLLVEDETTVAVVVKAMLARLGHWVVGPVAKLDQAIEIAHRELLDLAILDVDLRGTEVYPVAEVLGARGIPFVFLTGYGIEGVDTRYRDRPALSKPFRSSNLQQALAEACRNAT